MTSPPMMSPLMTSPTLTPGDVIVLPLRLSISANGGRGVGGGHFLSERAGLRQGRGCHSPLRLEAGHAPHGAL